MWVLCRDDVRWITIYEGRRSVAMASLTFYKRGVPLSEVYNQNGLGSNQKCGKV